MGEGIVVVVRRAAKQAFVIMRESQYAYVVCSRD